MAYSVDLQYTINEDFSGLQTVSESGQPASMSLQGLESYQTYYTKAVLKKDGVIEDESEIESFQTLPAGTITLTHYQTVRSGYAYDVTYTYTSTYAPSWATLSVNGSTFQGTFDSAQHAVSFLVTGLTPGTAYLDLVTLGDIYGETGSVQGSIVTTVVNDIDITSVETAYTNADVNVEYIVDGGFYVGYVEWWLSTQDPSTDPAEGHEYFNNGAETVTISGLNEGTDYKFRASITLADQTTTIVSNVVAATTKVNYATKYFTIENTSGQSNSISYTGTQYGLMISLDNGVTWNTSMNQGQGTNLLIRNLSSGKKMLMRHNGAFGSSGTAFTISSTGSIKVYGNLASLTHGDNFIGTYTMPDYAFTGLFSGNTNLTDVKDVSFSSYNAMGINGCASMFSGCTSITTPPEIPLTTLSAGCYNGMFSGCTSLATAPELPARTLSTSCYQSMFSRCTSLTTPPLLPATTLAASCYYGMFYRCTSLSTASSLPATTLTDGCYREMFYECTSLRNAPELPASRLTKNCYLSMFEGCTALKSTPELTATELSDYCYQRMFNRCSSLETVSDLPASTLPEYCYQYMFQNCTSLTDAPNMKEATNVGLNSIHSMFNGCRRLKTAYAPSVDTWSIVNASNWLNNVDASGTVYKPSDLTIPTGTPNGVPSGWTTQDY